MDDISDFSGFVAAASVEPIQPSARDVLDDIEDWVKVAAAGIRQIRERLDVTMTAGDALFGESFYGHELTSACNPDGMLRATWETSVVLFNLKFVQPKKVAIDCGEFLQAAFGLKIGCRSDITEAVLMSWSAAKARRHFETTIGDTRELAIRQMREDVLRDLHRRPEELLRVYGSPHRASHKAGMMEITYEHRPVERFERVIRYLVYLGGGAHPADSESLPYIFGYSDGAKIWPRKELFKRQPKPLAGVEWIRFTADSGIEIQLTRGVSAMLQAQWDAKTRADQDR